MKIIVSHPTGNANVRAILSNFSRYKILAEFNTTIATSAQDWWLKALPLKVKKQLLRRNFPINADLIHTYPLRESLRLLSQMTGLKNNNFYPEDSLSIDSVYQSLDRKVAKRLVTLKDNNRIDAVYAYEDGALTSFQQAKKIGIRCIYDLPIAYWQYGKKLMQEEAARLPQWAHTLGGGIKDSIEKLERKTKEFDLADTVIVPSEFVKNSLPFNTVAKKIVCAYFGSPVADITTQKEKSNQNKPLRILFAGSMGQRKGLGDLFSAVKMLRAGNNVELVVMGKLLSSPDFYRKEFSRFSYESPRPHQEVLALMQSCDILCLPSIVEGRALVVQEAMSQGLPVIITANTGCSDLVKEKQTGFMVPIRSPELIAEKISWLLDNRPLLSDMKEQAKQHASMYTWEKYGEMIINSLNN